MRKRKGEAYIYGNPASYWYTPKTEEEIQAIKDRWKAKKEAEEAKKKAEKDEIRKERERKEQNFVKISEFVREFIAQNQPDRNIFKQEQRLFCKIGHCEVERKSSEAEKLTVTREEICEYTYKEDEEIIATIDVWKCSDFIYYLYFTEKKQRLKRDIDLRLRVNRPIEGKIKFGCKFVYLSRNITAVSYLSSDINNVVDPLLRAALFVYKYGTNSSGDCLENEYGVYTGWLLLPAVYITKEVLNFVKIESVGTYEALRVKLELAA